MAHLMALFRILSDRYFQALSRRYENLLKRFDDLHAEVASSTSSTLAAKLAEQAAEHQRANAQTTEQLEQEHAAALLDAASRTRAHTSKLQQQNTQLRDRILRLCRERQVCHVARIFLWAYSHTRSCQPKSAEA